jgi:hypothetical protein
LECSTTAKFLLVDARIPFVVRTDTEVVPAFGPLAQNFLAMLISSALFRICDTPKDLEKLDTARIGFALARFYHRYNLVQREDAVTDRVGGLWEGVLCPWEFCKDYENHVKDHSRPGFTDPLKTGQTGCYAINANREKLDPLARGGEIQLVLEFSKTNRLVQRHVAADIGSRVTQQEGRLVGA